VSALVDHPRQSSSGATIQKPRLRILPPLRRRKHQRIRKRHILIPVSTIIISKQIPLSSKNQNLPLPIQKRITSPTTTAARHRRRQRHPRQRELTGVRGEQVCEAGASGARELGHIVVRDIQLAGFGVEFVQFVL
jgi:hypothetical protein